MLPKSFLSFHWKSMQPNPLRHKVSVYHIKRLIKIKFVQKNKSLIEQYAHIVSYANASFSLPNTHPI